MLWSARSLSVMHGDLPSRTHMGAKSELPSTSRSTDEIVGSPTGGGAAGAAGAPHADGVCGLSSYFAPVSTGGTAKSSSGASCSTNLQLRPVLPRLS